MDDFNALSVALARRRPGALPAPHGGAGRLPPRRHGGGAPHQGRRRRAALVADEGGLRPGGAGRAARRARRRPRGGRRLVGRRRTSGAPRSARRDNGGLHISYLFLDDEPPDVARQAGTRAPGTRWSETSVVPLLAAPFHSLVAYDWGPVLPLEAEARRATPGRGARRRRRRRRRRHGHRRARRRRAGVTLTLALQVDVEVPDLAGVVELVDRERVDHRGLRSRWCSSPAAPRRRDPAVRRSVAASSRTPSVRPTWSGTPCTRIRSNSSTLADSSPPLDASLVVSRHLPDSCRCWTRNVPNPLVSVPANVHPDTIRMWDWLNSPVRWITSSSVSRMSSETILRIPKSRRGTARRQVALDPVRQAKRRVASCELSHAPATRSSSLADSMSRSMPVSYAPVIAQYRSSCCWQAGRADRVPFGPIWTLDLVTVSGDAGALTEPAREYTRAISLAAADISGLAA